VLKQPSQFDTLSLMFPEPEENPEPGVDILAD